MGWLSGSSKGPSQVPGWALTANDFIDRAVLVVLLSVMWIVFTLLGLVVLGAAPATCSAADILRTRREDRTVHVFADMWRGYRQNFVRANTRMLPLMFVQVCAALTIWMMMQQGGMGPMLVVSLGVAVVALAWSTASLSMVVANARVRRQDLLVSYRLALLLPGAVPLRTLGVLALVAIWSVIAVTIPLVGFLLGAGIALEICGAMLANAVDDLLERIDTESRAEVGVDHSQEDMGASRLAAAAAHDAARQEALRRESGADNTP